MRGTRLGWVVDVGAMWASMLAGAACGLAVACAFALLPAAGWPAALAAAPALWALSALECSLRDSSGPGVIDGNEPFTRMLSALIGALVWVLGPVWPLPGAAPPPEMGRALLGSGLCLVWVVAAYPVLAGFLSEYPALPPWAGLVVPFWFGLPAAALSDCPAFAVPAWLVLCLAFRRRWFSLALRARAFAAVGRAG